MRARWCWGCCGAEAAHRKHRPKKTSVHVDGRQPLAEMGFKAWRLSEGRWELRLKSGCCQGMDAAVRALLLSGAWSKSPSPAE